MGEVTSSVGDLLGHTFDTDSSGWIAPSSEAFEWAEDLRLKMVPHELEHFDACARSVGLVLSEQASACVEHGSSNVRCSSSYS